MAALQYDYIAFVDEAGEPGLRKVRPIDEDGASEWLIMSAVVMRAQRESEITDWLSKVKQEVGLDRTGPLHFRNLSPKRRLAVAEWLAKQPVRCFAICSNKKNMRGYCNPRAEKISSQEWFYNWCIRLLLERVTAFVAERRAKDETLADGLTKIEFSRRGGHRYSQTNAYVQYLRHRERTGALTLTKRVIDTDLLNTDLMEHHPHWSRPGLQLADIAASAFYSASNTIGPGEWDMAPALALAPVMARERNAWVDFGVALQPTPAWRAELNDQQKQVYERYGYDFRRWW